MAPTNGQREVLNALQRLPSPARLWQVARNLHISETAARTRLGRLTAQGLVKPAGTSAWELTPAASPLGAATGEAVEGERADLLACMKSDRGRGREGWWGPILLARWEARRGLRPGTGAAHASALAAANLVEPAGPEDCRRWRAR